MNVDRAEQRKEQLELNIPNSAWEPIYFEEINARTKLAGLSNLRSIQLLGNDLELRMWNGFGATPVQGVVIRRSNGQWSGIHLIAVSIRKSQPEKRVIQPKSGWEHFWKRITDEGILTLPDSSELKNEVLFPDAEAYVVEINMNSSYRTYKYTEPQLQAWPEAKHMRVIAEIFSEEFGIKM